MELDIKLYLGNEIYLTDNIIKLLEDGKASTLNNSNYVLFEMPFEVKPLNLYSILYEILKYKLVPILAHPERYTYVQKDPRLVGELIEKGVLMQSNFGSVIGQYGRKAQVIVKKMLQKNMIHFLGSDVHRQNTVYKKMPKILNELKKVISEEKLNELTTVNPELVLNNKKIEV